MYAFVSGTLAEINPAFAVIACGGIGFQVHITLNTYTAIKDLQECKLYTHHVVREDAHALYGFFTPEEREIFRHLISVSGIGPNTARMILSSVTTEEVIAAIANEQVAVFQRIKGIGLKSAQRIIIDLKDKIGKGLKLQEISLPRYNTYQQEALSALVLLGFNKVQAGKAVEKAAGKMGPEATVESLIKECLKML